MDDPERRKSAGVSFGGAISTRYSSESFEGASVKYSEEYVSAMNIRTRSENRPIVTPLFASHAIGVRVYVV